MNSVEVDPDGSFVLYWMTAFRRLDDNFALQRAVDWCRELNKPLLLLEGLRCDYPWASRRHHAFVVDGMAEHAARLAGTSVAYYPYLERESGQGKGLLSELAGAAAVVVGDDYPGFFLPAMLAAAADHVKVRFEVVDSNGLLPLRAADKIFHRAYDFRRFLQKNLAEHLTRLPLAKPLKALPADVQAQVPESVLKEWPAVTAEEFDQRRELVEGLPVADSPEPAQTGGSQEAAQRLEAFLQGGMKEYDESHKPPAQQRTSRLSPYLHFGYIASHRIFADLMRRQEWTPAQLSGRTDGKRSGWWGVSAGAESFLDQLVTWRELGFNRAWQDPDYDQYETLPDWARKTLADHEDDERNPVYTLEQFAAANTHDELWNAAQRQLLRDGVIANYLRMLWGKKILHWSRSPREALEIMIELNNRYALDGRDPNSISGIFWVLGRYDRAWGPERPIFGKIRYMTSDSTARKLDVKAYLEKYR